METLADPSTIRFTQASIRRMFGDGRLLRDVIADLIAGKLSADDFPPIRTFERDEVLFSLDNRRLFVFRQAGVPIRTVPATAEEVETEAFKFTTINDGISVVVRGGL